MIQKIPTQQEKKAEDVVRPADDDRLARGDLPRHQLGGPVASDAIASVLIGVLLGITAIGLARPLADLLIGQSVRPERLGLARRTLEGSPAVDEVRQLYAVHVAPQEAILAAKVRPDSRLRAELPEIGEVFIDITDHREGGDGDG